MAAAGVVGVAVGFALGWGLRGTGEPDPAAALARLRSSVVSVVGTLEVVDVEYRESVRDGQVVRSTEYRGARDALARARERYLEARAGLEALDPGLVARADALFGEASGLLARRAGAGEVSAVLGELTGLLRGALGGGSPG